MVWCGGGKWCGVAGGAATGVTWRGRVQRGADASLRKPDPRSTGRARSPAERTARAATPLPRCLGAGGRRPAAWGVCGRPGEAVGAQD
eukprot:scaffold60865_cov18-Phaeocystis_antarctica.AAC.1